MSSSDVLQNKNVGYVCDSPSCKTNGGYMPLYRRSNPTNRNQRESLRYFLATQEIGMRV